MAWRILSSILLIAEKLASPCRGQPEPSSSSAPSPHHPCELAEEVEKLRRTAARIQLVLHDAEEREIREQAVKGWLAELRDVAHEAEDVLEQYDYELLRRDKAAELPHGGESGKVSDSPITEAQVGSSGEGVLSRIRGCRSRFEEISRECEILRLREEDGVRRADNRVRPPTGSYVEESGVYGRESDRVEVIRRLLSQCQGNGSFGVVPIVGMGGVGKTTLAQLVYNDSRICDHFSVKAWVYVSEEFDVLRITKALVEACDRRPCEHEELSCVQQILRAKLGGERFLIVLDDVWNVVQQSLWESLRSPLTAGAKGSKVLITTRDIRVANVMKTVPFYYLNCLSGDDCWLLFQSRAFEGRDPSNHPGLVRIGRMIVDKCEGLPLAAKALGSLLHYEDDEERWHDVLQNDLWNINEGNDEILSALKLSYYHLPSHLRHCFVYCSIFPKGHMFKREHLVRLWMANGFIQRMEGGREEDVGSEYVDELVWRSFFQESEIHVDEYKRRHFVMHNLVHDLARSISGKECSRIDDGNSFNIVKGTRHSAFTPCNAGAAIQFQSLCSLSSLRTFVIIHSGGTLDVNIPNDAFLKMGCLRSLDLSYTKIKHLPDSLHYLIHLRFLGLNSTKIKRLPESICSLYYLQTLEMRGCMMLHELPRDISNLTNLRHLELPEHVSMPPGIGKLTNLQSLGRFRLQRDKEHCGIGELRDLVNIRGDLCISGLRNIIRAEDVKEANMENKKYLGVLKLDWFGDKFCSRDENGSLDDLKTLHGLQPHLHIKEIQICYYGGSSFPGWISDALYSKLRSIWLYRCSKTCKLLPSLGWLPALKFLYIDHMDGVEYVGGEFCGHATGHAAQLRAFSSLEVLKFREMYRWKAWEGVEAGDFPHLQELHITDCPKLVGLPRPLLSLTKLSMQHCRRLTLLPDNLPFLSHLSLGACHQDIWHSLPHKLPMLKSFNVAYFKSLNILPLPGLTALKTLEILDCPRLSSIGPSYSSSLVEMISLERLKIKKCPKLSFMSVVRPPSTLKYVEVKECPLLEEWYQQVASDERVFLASVGQKNFRSEQRKLKEDVSPYRTRLRDECSEAGVPLHRAKPCNKRLQRGKCTQRNAKRFRSVKKAQHKSFDPCNFWRVDDKMDVHNSVVNSDAHSFIQFEPLKTTLPALCLPDLNAEPILSTICMEQSIHYHGDLLGSQHSWSNSNVFTSPMHGGPVDLSLCLKHAAQVDLALRVGPLIPTVQFDMNLSPAVEVTRPHVMIDMTHELNDPLQSGIDLNALPVASTPIIIDLTHDSDNPDDAPTSSSRGGRGEDCNLSITISCNRYRQTAEASGSISLSLGRSDNTNQMGSITASNFADWCFSDLEPSGQAF